MVKAEKSARLVVSPEAGSVVAEDSFPSSRIAEEVWERMRKGWFAARVVVAIFCAVGR